MWDWLQNGLGQVSDGQYNSLPQVQRVDPSAYQLPGLSNYLSGVSGLGAQSAGNTLDNSAANGVAGRQGGNLDQLQAYANGTAPSAAQLQLQAQRQQMLQGMQATALSNQSGVNPALAYRGLLGAQATADQNMGAVAAQQRAGEQQMAQTQYANALQGVRGQDMQQAGQEFGARQSGISQQAGLLQQGFGAQQYNQQQQQAFNNAQINQSMGDRQRQLQQNQSSAGAWGVLGKGLVSAGAGALSGGLGMALGGALGGAAANGAMQGGISAFGAQNGGGQGGFQEPAPQFNPNMQVPDWMRQSGIQGAQSNNYGLGPARY